MSSSRPPRPGFLPTEPAPAPLAGGATAVEAPPGPSFEELRSKHEALVKQRGRLELLHEQAGMEIRLCEVEAAALGVSSVEELRALIERTEAQDQKALDQFQAGIEAEAELQKRVLSDLEAIGE